MAAPVRRRTFIQPLRRLQSAIYTTLQPVLGTALFLSLAMVVTGFSRMQSASAQATGITATADPRLGEQIYQSRGCNKCHGAQGEAVIPPGPNGAMPQIASTPLALPSFIELVRMPKGQMPAYSHEQVSNEQLADVYAFLKSSAPVVENEVATAGDASNGQQLYVKYGCAECHLNHGQGSRITGVRLAPVQMPASEFISYVRAPTGEMPPYTRKVVSNKELADMYAFLQSVPPPPSWKSIPLLNQ